MKATRLTALLLATALFTNYATAEVDVMNVTLKDGAKAQFNVSQIEDMTFAQQSAEPEATEFYGHEYVDLGLPSGMKWATCNVGATDPAETGNYYAWGELSVKGLYNIFKSDWSGYTFARLQDNGVIDANGNLTPDFDLATRAWGEHWRMPTMEEFQELIDCCTWFWLADDDMVGAIITGPNGNSIFMPAAGNYHEFRGEHGRYWSATVYPADDRSWVLYFCDDNHYVTKDLRGTGIPIRPVTDGEEFSN